MVAKARPSYPTAAIEFLSALLPPSSQQTPYKVLDLGAGTGIMTKLLVPYFTVTAVEPVDNMRQKLESFVPEAVALNGAAWSIPLPDASQDMVMLAQCFHWFDDIRSLQEIHRVLKPGGIIVLIWNMESKERSEWVARLRA
jgi:ubiquinone/menaquinone biosynthesis C-methylase UbiE